MIVGLFVDGAGQNGCVGEVPEPAGLALPGMAFSACPSRGAFITGARLRLTGEHLNQHNR